MGVKIFTPPNTSLHDHYISLQTQGFGFSAKFIKDESLKESIYVNFGHDTSDDFKFYVSFPNKKDETCFELQGHNKKNLNRTVKGGYFINQNIILQQIFKDKTLSPQQRRFPLMWDKSSSMYTFRVIPNFEKTISPNELVSVNCIYRYRDSSNEIIYIGIGDLKKRFKAPEKSSWIHEVKTVEFSPVPEKKEREKFENIYLKSFKNNQNSLPKYNKNLGKKH